MTQITQQNKAIDNPFASRTLPDHVNAGTVSIEEQRAIAEVQGKIIVAKKFPRNQAAAYDAVMISCARLKLAESSMYSYPRGGETISGPSIRLAEELARAWGNIDYGIRELSQKEGVSEMEAYCWDMESNVVSSQKFTVKHERHSKLGVKKLTDPRDIYELTANNAGRRLRARILAILPPDLIEGAIDACNRTLKGTGTPADVVSKVTRMLTAFGTLSVTAEMIEERLQKKTADLTADEVVELGKIYTSIKDNFTSVADWFSKETETGDDNVDELRRELATPTFNAPVAATEKPIPQTKEPKATTTTRKRNTTADQDKARVIAENLPGPQTKEEFSFTPPPDDAVAGMPPIFDEQSGITLDLSEEI